MNSIKIIGIIYVVFLASIARSAEVQSPVNPYKTIIHAHSDVSGGAYDFDELVAVAKGYDVDAVFMTDNHWLSFQYGLPWLQQIAWVSKSIPSVLEYGPRRYLRKLRKANRKQDDVLLIPGLEVIPRYYWTGSPLKGDLTHWNMQRNLLILGVDDPKFIANLPVSAGFVKGRDALSIFFSRALVVWLIVALSLIGWVPKARAFWRHRSLRTARSEFIMVVLLPTALVMLLFNLFQSTKTRDVYGQKIGVDAEQRVVDAAIDAEYFCYWAHPEASDNNQFGPVQIKTSPYPELLSRTRNYSGFGALYEQGNELYLAGKEWDQVLLDYVNGVRGFPAWAIGEMLYRSEDHANKKMHNVETIIWAPEKTQDSLIRSLKQGRFYSRRRAGEDMLKLNEFSVNGLSSARGSMTLNTTGIAKIKVSIAAEQPLNTPVVMTIVKNGKVFHEAEVTLPAEVTLEDRIGTSSLMVYYRVYVRGAYPLQLVSNPIFIQ